MSDKNYEAIWHSCLDSIKERIPEQSFKTWFEPIQAVEFSENELVIEVPNKFFYEWLEDNYITLLRETLHKEIGQEARLKYHIMTPQKKSATSAAVATEDLTMPELETSESIVNPFVIPGIKKIRIDSQLKRDYTFETYIEGSCNRLARSAGMSIAENPGGTAFNPLFIFGDVGLGKTHLAQAIGNAVRMKFKNKTVLYVTADKFTNQFIHAIKNNAVNDFENFYLLIDVLIIDDIQFLSGKTKTQDMFFHIFNQLHQNNKQLILTSDVPPKDLKGIQDRLISRFKWGLSADLSAPELETRMAILEHKMDSEGMSISDDVAEFICYNIKNNIRELEGVLVSLIAQSSLNQRNVDMSLAREVIKNFVSQINKEISVEFIQKLVADYYDLTIDKLQGKTRKRSIVIARQLSMYLAKHMTNKSLKAIGEQFGGRDHSTVIYSCTQVKNLMDTDAVFKETVADIEKKIRMSLHEAG